MCVSRSCRLSAVAQAGDLNPVVITDVDEEETALTFTNKRLAAPVVAGIGVAQATRYPALLTWS